MLSSHSKIRSRLLSDREFTKSAWGLRLIWIAYISVLFVMTHTPVPHELSDVTSQWDKLLHFGAYAVLCILTCLVHLQNGSQRIPAFKIAMALIAYGAIDEILQGPVGRTPDVADWVADSSGILIGIGIVKLFLKLAAHSAIPDWASRLLLNSAPIDSAVK